MGALTGKGLSDLIREEFGLRMTFFTMSVLGLADLGNIVTGIRRTRFRTWTSSA